MEIQATDKRKEAEREVKMRRSVYPRWVSGGRFTQQEADRRIAVMEAIVEDYRKLEQKELLL